MLSYNYRTWCCNHVGIRVAAFAERNPDNARPAYLPAPNLLLIPASLEQ